MRKRPDEVEVEIDEEEVGVRPATAKRRDSRIWGRRASTLDDVRSLPLMAGRRRFKGGGGSLSGRNAEEGRLGCVCVGMCLDLWKRAIQKEVGYRYEVSICSSYRLPVTCVRAG